MALLNGFRSRSCPVCDDVAIRPDPPTASRRPIDVERTTAALIRRTAAGQMRVLRADVALEDMLPLAESELRYTVVSFLQCMHCHATKLWGLCIRGEPLYRTEAPGAELRWRWQPVPPRHEWVPVA